MWPWTRRKVISDGRPPREGFPPVQLPVEWVGARRWRIPLAPRKGLKHARTGRWHYLMSGVLEDGTVIVALTWKGGCNAARLSPDTGWALQEHVTPESGSDTRDIWGQAVSIFATAHRKTREERGERRGR